MAGFRSAGHIIILSVILASGHKQQVYRMLTGRYCKTSITLSVGEYEN